MHTHLLHFIEHPPQSAPGGVVRSVKIRGDRVRIQGVLLHPSLVHFELMPELQHTVACVDNITQRLTETCTVNKSIFCSF